MQVPLERKSKHQEAGLIASERLSKQHIFGSKGYSTSPIPYKGMSGSNTGITPPMQMSPGDGVSLTLFSFPQFCPACPEVRRRQPNRIIPLLSRNTQSLCLIFTRVFNFPTRYGALPLTSLGTNAVLTFSHNRE